MNEEKPRMNLIDKVREKVGRVLPRLSVPLTEDGGVAIPKTDKVKEQLKSALGKSLQDPEFVRELGLDGAAAVPAAKKAAEPDVDSKDLAGLALEGLSRLGVLLARRAGYSERASAVVALSSEERAHVAPAAVAVIDKYMPASVGRYAEELQLLIALAAVVVGKVQLLRAAAQQDAPERMAA